LGRPNLAAQRIRSPRLRLWLRPLPRPARRAVCKVPAVSASLTASPKARRAEKSLTTAGVLSEVVGPHLGTLKNGVEAVKTFANTSSVLYGAVYVPAGHP
jgi:hypothetical protein